MARLSMGRYSGGEEVILRVRDQASQGSPFATGPRFVMKMPPAASASSSSEHYSRESLTLNRSRLLPYE